MKKILFSILALILAACTSVSPQTQVTVTMEETVTLLPTATFTPVAPEPTDTLTPIPTATPFRYTSCADPELTDDIQKGFVEKIGMTFEDYVGKLVLLGKYDKAYYILSEEGNTQADYVLMGGAEISLANIDGAKEGDRAFCMYFADDSNASTLVPMVIAYTYQGNFHKTSWVHDGFETGATPFSLNSMEEVEEWWDDDSKKPAVGDVFVINYHSFEGVDTYEKVAELDRGTQSPFPEEVSRLLKLMGNDYLERIAGVGSPVTAAQALKSDLGDVGLFPNLVALKQSSPLGK